MGEVVTLKRPGERWASGKAKCLACKHEWMAVYQVPLADIECPSCGVFRGQSKGPFNGPETHAVWVCNCGNSLLELYVDKQGAEELLCVGCGFRKPVSS